MVFVLLISLHSLRIKCNGMITGRQWFPCYKLNTTSNWNCRKWLNECLTLTPLIKSFCRVAGCSVCPIDFVDYFFLSGSWNWGLLLPNYVLLFLECYWVCHRAAGHDSYSNNSSETSNHNFSLTEALWDTCQQSETRLCDQNVRCPLGNSL